MSCRNLATDSASGDEIRSRSCPTCFMCGLSGVTLYAGLADRLLDAAGVWNLKRCPNRKCGLIWLDPMPLEEDIGKAYAKYFTHAPRQDAQLAGRASTLTRAAELFRSSYLAWRFNYGGGVGKPLRWLLALPIFLSRIECDGLDIPLRYFAVPAKGRLLDVGCGNGSASKLALELGWKVEGLDFDPEAVENARRDGLNVRLGRLLDQHFPSDSFDLVWMSHVIEHIHDPLATLREIVRVLRPRGMLVVTTPNADSLGHRLFGADWRGLEPPRHLHIFNTHNLASLAIRAGFGQYSMSSTLRITIYTFVQSRLVRQFGHAEDGQRTPMRDLILGRAAAIVETMKRMSNPAVAGELLLEARK